MDDRTQLDPTFFSLPECSWGDVGRQVFVDLSRIHLAIGLVLSDLGHLFPDLSAAGDLGGTTAGSTPGPAELALTMHEIAGQILGLCARDEQDLRQIISTLRTGLAVCWDLYSVRESERVTVAEHMRNLRVRIEDFERELVALRGSKNSGTSETLN
jgi:hypothetical protein